MSRPTTRASVTGPWSRRNGEMDADGLLDRITTRVTALALTWEGNPLPVGKRKVPVAQEALNEPPQVAICKAPRAEEVQRWGGIYDRHTYYFRVALLTAGRHDYQANLPAHAQFRRTILATFARKAGAGLDDVTGLQDVRSRPDEFLPSERMGRGWDTQVCEIEVSVVEERGT